MRHSARPAVWQLETAFLLGRHLGRALGYQQNLISFEFAALSFSNPMMVIGMTGQIINLQVLHNHLLWPQNYQLVEVSGGKKFWPPLDNERRPI